MSFTWRIATVLICLSGFLSVFGGENPESKSYHLFNPVPDGELRELSPDRPDTTESPITVDAGRFVIEASYFDWRRDPRHRNPDDHVQQLEVGPYRKYRSSVCL